MKKYIQITAGRGSVECARAVALVEKEMLKANPAMRLVESEPQHRARLLHVDDILNRGRASRHHGNG